MTQERHIEEEREEVIVPMENGSKGTSLILVKRNKVDEEFEALGLGLRKAQATHRRVDGAAWKDGQSAGDRVNLHRPIGGAVSGLLK